MVDRVRVNRDARHDWGMTVDSDACGFDVEGFLWGSRPILDFEKICEGPDDRFLANAGHQPTQSHF